MKFDIEVNWDIDSEDVGCDEYENYKLLSINFNESEKEIWSVTYSYVWDCGDGCCSETLKDIAYVGQLSKFLKKRILEFLPGYKFQTD